MCDTDFSGIWNICDVPSRSLLQPKDLVHEDILPLRGFSTKSLKHEILTKNKASHYNYLRTEVKNRA